MRTLFFILPFIFITTGCIKQNTEKSDILTTEDIAKFDSLFNAWEKEIHNNPKAQLSSSTRAYTILPQFKELKAMGKKIIPCIIEQFEKDNNTFFALPLYDELQDNDSLKSHRETSEQDKVREIVQKFREQEKRKMWEEANRYKTSITDTTFLKTRGTMSYAAIDLFTGRGFNKDYAFNQVVYLKALQRAQKHLSVVNGQLACDLKSGTEIYISEDLYLFITDLFKDWNTWLKSGKYEIIKDEQGLYTVLPKKTNQSSQTNSVILRPIPRDIPTGEDISPASLSIETEHDHYPLSTTEVKITITNHSHYEYECGEKYSLAYYNKSKRQWETLPTDPVVNDILWIFPPEHPSHQQTIKLYTSESPNHPGKYRIYKSFNRGTKVAYGEFELLP